MEYIIPVRHSGIKNYRIMADNLKDAIAQVEGKAQMDASFEFKLSDSHMDILMPRLMLSDEERETWPYWEYWYTGTDGVDWRVGYTRDGKSSIPDYAESSYPVPDDWIESWKSE